MSKWWLQHYILIQPSGFSSYLRDVPNTNLVTRDFENWFPNCFSSYLRDFPNTNLVTRDFENWFPNLGRLLILPVYFLGRALKDLFVFSVSPWFKINKFINNLINRMGSKICQKP